MAVLIYIYSNHSFPKKLYISREPRGIVSRGSHRLESLMLCFQTRSDVRVASPVFETERFRG